MIIDNLDDLGLLDAVGSLTKLVVIDQDDLAARTNGDVGTSDDARQRPCSSMTRASRRELVISSSTASDRMPSLSSLRTSTSVRSSTF